MIRKLRERMGRLGVVMTFLAVLFAITPTLEAVACAAEGCSIACLDETAASGAEDSDPTPGGCAELHCIWSAGHSHVATSQPSAIGDAHVAPATLQRFPFAAETLVSAIPDSLERPPRA
jgi:hypothetical protein